MNKSARGKKRWVGVEFESGATVNRQLIRSLSEDLDTVEIAWVSDNEKTLILG